MFWVYSHPEIIWLRIWQTFGDFNVIGAIIVVINVDIEDT